MDRARGFLPFFAYVSNLKPKRRKAFSNEFFLPKGWGGAVIAGAVICWLLSYWFNCLFSLPALPVHGPMTSFWLRPLHTCQSAPPRPTQLPPRSQHQLNLTVLNEWNNTELTSGGKSLPPPPPPLSSIPSLLLRLLTCQRLWGECPDLCKKKKARPARWWLSA